MVTYCGHSNAPVEYALKEEEEEAKSSDIAMCLMFVGNLYFYCTL